MITSTSATTAASQGSTTDGAGGTNTLGKDAFLKLLLAQLKNQDPLQPVDNQAFIAQLAQFSTVEQLQGLGSRLDTLLVAQASANQMNTTSLVGKDVLFKSDSVSLAAGTPATAQVKLAAAADVTVQVQDASGKVVRTLTFPRSAAGNLDVSWDGLDASGNAMAPGSYKLLVTAKDSKGATVDAETRVRGRVQGVSFDGDTPMLLIGSLSVKLSDVIQINQG